MQALLNHIYKSVSTKSNKDYDLVKSVGDAVFKSLLHNIKHPSSLILKVKGIGSFYMRHKKLRFHMESYRDFYTNPENEKQKNAIIQNEEEFLLKQKQYLNLFNRVEDYKRYVAKKKMIKEIRNKTQPLIEIKKDEDE